MTVYNTLTEAQAAIDAAIGSQTADNSIDPTAHDLLLDNLTETMFTRSSGGIVVNGTTSAEIVSGGAVSNIIPGGGDATNNSTTVQWFADNRIPLGLPKGSFSFHNIDLTDVEDWQLLGSGYDTVIRAPNSATKIFYTPVGAGCDNIMFRNFMVNTPDAANGYHFMRHDSVGDPRPNRMYYDHVIFNNTQAVPSIRLEGNLYTYFNRCFWRGGNGEAVQCGPNATVQVTHFDTCQAKGLETATPSQYVFDLQYSNNDVKFDKCLIEANDIRAIRKHGGGNFAMVDCYFEQNCRELSREHVVEIQDVEYAEICRMSTAFHRKDWVDTLFKVSNTHFKLSGGRFIMYRDGIEDQWVVTGDGAFSNGASIKIEDAFLIQRDGNDTASDVMYRAINGGPGATVQNIAGYQDIS